MRKTLAIKGREGDLTLEVRVGGAGCEGWWLGDIGSISGGGNRRFLRRFVVGVGGFPLPVETLDVP